jgi:hypothetical protein
MALAKRELEEIIARDVPGYKLARQHAAQDYPSIEPDESSPDIESLRAKYLGSEAEQDFGALDGVDHLQHEDNPGPAGEVAAGDADSDAMIVAIEPEAEADAFDAATRPKTVVISGRSKRVIGRQG